MIKSFSYMFKETNFLKKFLMLFAFILIANFLINLAGILAPLVGKESIWYNISLIIGYIIMFIPYGYSMALLKSNMSPNSNFELPQMDIFQCFKDGCKVVFSALILLISLLVIIAGLVFASNVLSEKFGGVGFSFVYTFVFLIFLIMSFMGIAMCCRYVIKPSWFNFVNFKPICDIINNNVGKYFIVYLITMAIAIIVAIISTFLSVILPQIGFTGFVLYNLFVSLLWSYVIFVLAKLFSHAVNAEKI